MISWVWVGNLGPAVRELLTLVLFGTGAGFGFE